MVQISIQIDQQQVFEGEAQALSPMGFHCLMDCAAAEHLRSQQGRFQQFEVNLQLSTHSGPYLLQGMGIASSVRRVSQQQCYLEMRFIDLAQDGYRRIAEHLAEPLVEMADVVDLPGASGPSVANDDQQQATG